MSALDGARRSDLNERVRRAFVERAEQGWQRCLGRPMTAAELERVLLRYPGDPYATKGRTLRAVRKPLCDEG
jgi:hypothetical protein